MSSASYISWQIPSGGRHRKLVLRETIRASDDLEIRIIPAAPRRKLGRNRVLWDMTSTGFAAEFGGRVGRTTTAYVFGGLIGYAWARWSYSDYED